MIAEWENAAIQYYHVAVIRTSHEPTYTPHLFPSLLQLIEIGIGLVSRPFPPARCGSELSKI